MRCWVAAWPLADIQAQPDQALAGTLAVDGVVTVDHKTQAIQGAAAVLTVSVYVVGAVYLPAAIDGIPCCAQPVHGGLQGTVQLALIRAIHVDIVHIPVIVPHAIQAAHIAVKCRHGQILEPVACDITDRQAIGKTLHHSISQAQPVLVLD